MEKKKFGFTLIELLIVIAILGVLAVGLLATIDPFEQLKKGRDTSTRNMTEEAYNALLRYYSIKNEFPWASASQVAVSLDAAGMFSYLSQVYEAGELKQAFLDSSGLEEILVTSTACEGNCEDLTVCFQPQSKAFRNDNNSKYNSAGSLITADCPNPTGSNCYWCLK